MLTYYLGLGSNKQEVRLWQWNCTVLNHSWFTSCILSLLHKFILSILSVILRCKSKVITHNHPEGIKGAQATAAAIFLSRNEKSKEYIREFIETTFDYDLHRTCDEIRPAYRFNESCQGTVPEAIIAFLESNSFEDAIRLAISLGGDSDTLACIAGGIAESFYRYQIPYNLIKKVETILEPDLWKVVQEFRNDRQYKVFWRNI